MANHQITIEIDEDRLAAYTDQQLAMCWQVAQGNPAEEGDPIAGELAERIGREIIRRWLRGVEPELWRHQARSYYYNELTRFAKFVPGGPPESDQWHYGEWTPRDSGDTEPEMGAELVNRASVDRME
jgi:hypothetical protein